MSTLPKINYYETPFTIAEAIETDPVFSEQKAYLSKFDIDSDEYVTGLLDVMPLREGLSEEVLQGAPLENSQDSGDFTPIFRNAQFNKKLVTALHPKAQTGYDLFQISVRTKPNNHCLGVRKCVDGVFDDHYTWETYSEVNTLIHAFGAGILNVVNIKRNKPLDNNDFKVALWAPNRREWVMTDLACQAYSLANTALYDTLGMNTSAYILNQTECPVVICAKDKILKLLEMLPKVPFVNTVVSMDELSNSELIYLNSLISSETNPRGERVTIMTMKQVISAGKLSPLAPIAPNPSTLYTISFTSGTTGMPKGVALRQLQYASSAAFCLAQSGVPKLAPGDSQIYYLSVLPLAHIYEREVSGLCLATATGIGFLHLPTPEAIPQNLAILKPHFFSGVPRIFTKFESGLKNVLGDATGVKKKLIDTIMSSRREMIAHNHSRVDTVTTKLQRKLLLNKIRDQLGFTRADFFITGSAPISPETLTFLKNVLDVGFRQGYGLTESFAGVFMSGTHEPRPGSCGPPGLSCEVKLRSIPSMNYYAKDMKGELMMRGPQIFDGYFKNDEETKKCLDEDGWFATGDIARIDKQGRIYIIDRVKNFFKLAQGEYIAPEKIENAYLSSCPLLAQLFVHGDSLKTFLVGIVGIDVAAVKKFFSRTYPDVVHYSDAHLVSFINDDAKIKRQLLLRINESIAKSGFQGFEKMHNIKVAIEPLKLQDETVTPTMKIKRAVCSKFFEKELAQLYEEGSIIKNGKL